MAEGIYHLQPAPPLDTPSYKKFVKEMGPAGTVFLFAGNAHDQICVTALAMEHANQRRPGLGQPFPRSATRPAR